MKSIDTILIVAIGGLGYYLWRKTQPAAGYPGVSTSTARPLVSSTAAPAQSRAVPVSTTAGTTVPYAPMIDAPAYAPPGWAPPSF